MQRGKAAYQINERAYDAGLSDYTIIKYVAFDDREYYELQNNKHPYRSNIWLKLLMNDAIMENIDAVVRVQTNSVSLNEEII